MNVQVFQKGSPIARDFSKAILTLSENKKLKSLEDYWFGSSSTKCSKSDSEESLEAERLRMESFWVLFLISTTTSTVCLLIFLISRYRKNRSSRNNGSTVVKAPPVAHVQQPKPPPRRSLSMALSRRNGSFKLDVVSPDSDYSA